MPKKVTVGYDLMAPGQKYDRVINAIHSLGPATKVLLSQWEIETELSCDAVYEYIKKFMDSNDVLYVAEVNRSRRTYNSLLVNLLAARTPAAVNGLPNISEYSSRGLFGSGGK